MLNNTSHILPRDMIINYFVRAKGLLKRTRRKLLHRPKMAEFSSTESALYAQKKIKHLFAMQHTSRQRESSQHTHAS